MPTPRANAALLFNREVQQMSISTIVDRMRALLDSTPPFDSLPDEERADLLTDVSVEYFKPGEVVIEQGTTVHAGLYIVESGMVRMMDLDTRRLIDKCGEGDFFGSFGLIKGGATVYQVKAVEPTVCALLQADRFQQLFQDYEDFADFFREDIKRYVRHIDTEMDVTGAHLLFTRRLKHLMHREPVLCPADLPVQRAARLMDRKGVDNLLILEHDQIAGILTDKDIRSRYAAQGHASDMPVHRLMSSPVLTVTTEASLFDAMMVMLNRRVHHIVITEEVAGHTVPVGILTDRDVAHFRGLDPIATVRRIDSTFSLSELASIRLQIYEQMLRLYRQGVQPELLNHIMASIYDCLAVRVLEIVEKKLRKKEDGTPVDLPWVWLRLGSGGRQEVSLTTEQHNAIIYANPSSEEEAARAEAYFNHLAEEAHAALEACGFPISDVIARDPRWRKPIREWQQSFREWVMQSGGEALATSPLFFDLRGIYGDLGLVAELKQNIEDALNVQAMDADRHFLTLMAANALEKKPPLSFLRRFKTERTKTHRSVVDIKERGILPVTDAARVLALEIRYLESTSTFDRLTRAAQALPELTKLLEEVRQAYRYLVDFRLENQLSAFEAGEQPDNYIDPYAFQKVQQNLLRDAFTTVGRLQEVLAERYGVEEDRGMLLSLLTARGDGGAKRNGSEANGGADEQAPRAAADRVNGNGKAALHEIRPKVHDGKPKADDSKAKADNSKVKAQDGKGAAPNGQEEIEDARKEIEDASQQTKGVQKQGQASPERENAAKQEAPPTDSEGAFGEKDAPGKEKKA